MKKIILLLLISGGLAAQVVVPKSTTTFSNVRAVGSMTVGGNLRVTGATTLTGAVTSNSTISGTSFLLSGSTALNQGATNRVTLAASGSFTSCEVSGSKPLILNGTPYTGGTTAGTVAVLSDVKAVYPFLGGAITPTDGQTFYCGTLKYPMSNNRTGGIYIPYNATIVGWTSTNIVASIGSSETYSLQCWQNNTTATNLGTSITSDAAVNTFSGTANISVSAGDYIETRFIGATWVTNPVGIEASVILIVQPR